MLLCSLLVALAAALITFALGVDLVEALLDLLVSTVETVEAPTVEAPIGKAPTVARPPRQPLPPVDDAPVIGRRVIAPFSPSPVPAGFTILPA
jgi:hypothetical protein